jgi:hypothetical protein
MSPSGCYLLTLNYYNLTANISDSGRHHGPTVARSIVLEAVNVDNGASELPGVAAEVFLHPRLFCVTVTMTLHCLKNLCYVSLVLNFFVFS